MTVACVERGDFAAGTSSKSSKLVHGGLRYLENRDFGLVREAAQERDLLRHLAPHLVESLAFVLPVADRWVRAKFGVGLWAYDALASFKNLHVHRYLGVEETESAIPSLPAGKVKGGFLFYDCKNDDVRLVMEVLIQATRHGALVANHASVIDLDGSENGCRAVIRDEMSGETMNVDAKRVIVAAGVWTDQLEAKANPNAAARVRPSKGIHLSFRRDRLPMGDAGAFIPDAERKRMLFVIPWLDAVIVGTTDTSYDGDIDHPTVTKEDSAYCIDAVNSVFHLGLTEDDVSGAWAGLRPLIAGEAGSTADLSRGHAVYEIAPGITGITGGKLTTYRRMAQEAVDLVSKSLGRETRCKTHLIRLGSSDADNLHRVVERRAGSLGIPKDQARNLARCYGDRAMDVLDIAADQGLTAPLVPGAQPISAEAVYCAQHEMVMQLPDLLQRRTRLALTDPAAGIGSQACSAAILGGALGWSSETSEAQISNHRAEVELERGITLNAEIDPEVVAGAGAS
jgi:glycerol-3-phosphate dehydrogenase